MTPPQVQIVNVDGIGQTTRVLVDGKPLTCVRSIVLFLDAENLVSANIEVDRVSVDATVLADCIRWSDASEPEPEAS